MDTQVPRHRDPIIFDTLVLLAIQGGFYVLSRRFLLHALPTLRSISKQGSLPEGAAEQDDQYAMKSLRGGGDGIDEDDDFDEEESNRLLNASGGYSDIEAGSQRNGTSRSHQRWRKDAESDSEDEMSDASYVGSPLPSAAPELASETDNRRMSGISTRSLIRQEDGAASSVHSPTIRTPGVSSHSSAPMSPSKRQSSQVIRLFKSKESSANGGRAGVNQKEKEKVGATRGLGFLARNLFSLCFAESLTLLLLVMFHSIGILHSRSRHVHFSISLHILLMLILLVVPWVQCMQLTYRARDASAFQVPGKQTTSAKRRLSVTKRFLVSLVPFGLYVFLFTRIPPYITTVDTSLSSQDLDEILRSGNFSQIVNGTRRISSQRLKAAFPHFVDLGDIAELEELDGSMNDTETEDQPDLDGDQEAYEDYEYAFEYYSQQQMWRKGGWLEPSLGRVVVCGVVVLGGLSGLGAVRTAWNFVESGGMGSGRMITKEDLINAERSLYRIRHDMVYRRGELSRRLGGTEARDGNGDSGQGWMGRVFANTLGRNQETNSMRREIQGLEALEQQIARGLDAMKLRRKRQRFARTFRGKIFNLIGMLFAVYCIARVMMCFVSVVFPPLATSKIAQSETAENDTAQAKGNVNGDWISYSIAWGLSRLPTGVVDIAVWSRAISLLLTGLLILSSLLQVLRYVSKVLRLTSKRIGAGFLLLTLGQLMSTYTISLLIQLRSFIPPSAPDFDFMNTLGGNSTEIAAIASQFQSHGETSLLASLPEFRVFGRLFDMMFLVGAIGTALYRYLSQRINGVDEYAQVYH